MYQRLTVAEAAAELGVSRMTVRRMIQRGQLEAERVHRPQGSLYVVRLPVDGTDQGTPTAQVPGHRARHNGTAQGAPAGQLAAWSETFLLPLVQTIERQAERIEELARENGRQAAELERAASTVVALSKENEALRVSHSPVAGQETASPPGPPREPLPARLRVLGPWVLTVLVIITVGVLLWTR
jgi:excisionase family DNA binding protein